MQVLANTTGMQAAVALAMDKDANDYCVVVVKGTFVTSASGTLKLAEKQRPLVYADEHYGDPETSAIRYESDFAPRKPLTDVVVVGKAVAPQGQAVASRTARNRGPGQRAYCIRGPALAAKVGAHRRVRTTAISGDASDI